LRHRNLHLLILQAREALMAQFRPILDENGVTEQPWRMIRAASASRQLLAAANPVDA
jgi:hypothetical protein